MTYPETLAYLYNSAPLFQHVGKAAYKEGLENTLALDEYFGHPHKKFRSIHIAGTNGKGSCSHYISSNPSVRRLPCGTIYISSSGRFPWTYPHKRDSCSTRLRYWFRGKTSFFLRTASPFFFRLTTAMAFHYFACQQVDVAVIEVGLGGRLDCTNIIHPDLCLITNISFDHVQFLGNTLEK